MKEPKEKAGEKFRAMGRALKNVKDSYKLGKPKKELNPSMKQSEY